MSGCVEPYALPRGAPLITHLAFADDLIILSKANRRSVSKLFDFLNVYELASGQQINKSKSSFLISRHSSVAHNRMVSGLSGIHMGKLPFKYLGCYLYKGRRKLSYFQHLVDAVNNRLVGWKNKFLSPGGRLILIKHVLSTIPIHVMAALDLPKGILDQLERIFSNFLWGKSDDSQRRVWRSWHRITFPFDENGLGIRKLHDVLSSFSCKLWWKWRTGSCLWSRYISSISPSKSLIYRRLAAVDQVMNANSRVLVSDGSSSFIYANWSGEGSLVQLFPDLFSTCPDVKLCDLFVDGGWRLQDLPAPVADFVAAYRFEFSSSPDRLIWEPEDSGIFSIKSALNIIRVPQQSHRHYSLIWSQHIPVRFSFFFWRLLNGLLPLPEALSVLGFQLPSKCPFCPAQDTFNHVFFHCRFAFLLWQWMADFIGFPVGSVATLREALFLFWDYSGNAPLQLLQVIPVFICWVVWKIRNQFLFDGIIPTRAGVLLLFKELVHNASAQKPFKVRLSQDLFISRF